MEDDTPSLVVDGVICSIKFSVTTSMEIHKSSISDSSISHPSQLKNPFLGLPVESGKCESCGTSDHEKCEGHFGYIQLPIPLYHPWHISELKRILSLLCLKCLRIKKGKILQNQVNKKSRSVPCISCQDVPSVSIREVKTTDGVFFLELKLPSRKRLPNDFWRFLDRYGYSYGADAHCRSLLPCEVLQILQRVPEETRRKLSVKGYFPQDGYIMQCLPVPPNCLCVPDVSDGTSIMSSDLSTSMLRKVLNKVEIIRRSRSGNANFVSHEIEANDLQSSVSQYMNLRGSKKGPHDMTRKFGIVKEGDDSSTKAWLEKMRTLFIRKGSGFSSRSVITGDCYRGVNEIGIPLEIAQKITFEERVTSLNIKHLQELVDKKLCVTYRDGSATYAIREGSKGHTYLSVGQIINRRIIDGDIVFINRPPSTHKHSLQAFSIYVHDDHTVKINPLICGPLGADFDGDCVHIFYPQSLAAKAEVVELFSVEKQLISSHTGNLNLQLVHDSLLSLKLMFRNLFLRKETAQQLSMHALPLLETPALVKVDQSGSFWTSLQLLETVLPSALDFSRERFLICNGQIMKVDVNRDVVLSVFTDVVTHIFDVRGPNEALRFFNLLQPLLMEILFREGYSVGLNDFDIPKSVCDDVKKNIQGISPLLHRLRCVFDEVVEVEIENHLKSLKLPIVAYILKSSGLGYLIDSKSDSSVSKLVQQLGFLGLQLYDRGKFYSKDLVEGIKSLYLSKFCIGGVDYPSEAFGLIRSSFIEGLNPYEALVHSISSREVSIRSSRGLTEPGVLFKNLMAILRDIVVCYDGTIRHSCGSSIILFDCGPRANLYPGNVCPAGEPVGVLAATAISNPAYKAVLDSSPTNNLSWELMKEILQCKVNFKNSVNDRRVILYLNDCECGKKYCKENAALVVQSNLKKARLKDFAMDFSIEYQKQRAFPENSEFDGGLINHIHLDKMRLKGSGLTLQGILEACQDVIHSFTRKKNNLSQIFKNIYLSVSEHCCFQQQYDGNWSELPCLQFTHSGPHGDTIERTTQIMADVICPLLLETIVKGDSRLKSANIVWIDPMSVSWVGKSEKPRNGEVALEVVVEKAHVKQVGDAWRIVLDCCLPVIKLIDTERSIPYGVQQIQELLGISCAFDKAVQRLSTSVRMVTKGVLVEHLMLVASSMTYTGSLIGFSSGGFKALFRALQVQVPFTEATLLRPMKCFERAAEKCHTDSLSSVVASCSWGKHVAVGTGSRFQILWNKEEVTSNQDIGADVYSFLELVKETSNQNLPSKAFLEEDIDDLHDDYENVSPEHNSDFPKATFEDDIELEKEEPSATWGKASASEVKSGSWGGWDVEVPNSGKSNAWGNGKLDDVDSKLPANSQKGPDASWEKLSTPEASLDVKSGWGGWNAQGVGTDGSSTWVNGKSGGANTESEELGTSWGRSSSPAGKSGNDTTWDVLTGPKSQITDFEKSVDGWNAKPCVDRNDSSIENPLQRSSFGGWNGVSDARGTQISEDTHKERSSGSNWGTKSDAWDTQISKDALKERSSQSNWGTKSDASDTQILKDTQKEISSGSSSGTKSDAWDTPVSKDTLKERSNWGTKSDAWDTPMSKDTQKERSSGSNWGTKSDAWNTPISKDTHKERSSGSNWGTKSDVWDTQISKDTQKESSSRSNWGPKSDAWDAQVSMDTQRERSSGSNWGTKSDAWDTQVSKDTLKERTSGSNWGIKSDAWDMQISKDTQKEKTSGSNWGTKSDVWNHQNRKESDTEKPVDIHGSNANSDTLDAQMSKDVPTESPSGVGGWNANIELDQLNQQSKSTGWGSGLSSGRGSSANVDRQNPKGRFKKPLSRNKSDDQDGRNAIGIFTATGKRMDIFTSEEEKVLSEVEPVMLGIKRIMRNPSYNDGDRLSTEDQSYVLDNVFMYHPDKASKLSEEISYVMVDKHGSFQETRCFYVVSTNDFKADFSYLKCMENFVKVKYPEIAEAFNRKYFRKRRSDATGEPTQ